MRPLISRIIAPFIAVLAAWLIGKGIPLPPEFAAQLTDISATLGYAIVIALGGVFHKTIDKKVNPADTAK